jgi:hypothetical protein
MMGESRLVQGQKRIACSLRASFEVKDGYSNESDLPAFSLDPCDPRYILQVQEREAVAGNERTESCSLMYANSQGLSHKGEDSISMSGLVSTFFPGWPLQRHDRRYQGIS